MLSAGSASTRLPCGAIGLPWCLSFRCLRCFRWHSIALRLVSVRRGVCLPFLPSCWHSIALRWYCSAVRCVVRSAGSASPRLPCGCYWSAVASVCGVWSVLLALLALDCRAVGIVPPWCLSFVPAGSASSRLPCGWYRSAVGLFSVFGLALLALDCRAVVLFRRGAVVRSCGSAGTRLPCGCYWPAVVSILRLLLCVGIVPPSVVFPLALDCPAVDTWFAVVSVVRSCGSAGTRLPCGGIVPPWRLSSVPAGPRLSCGCYWPAVASVCRSCWLC